MAPSLTDEVAAAFASLAAQREADAASVAAWRAHSVDAGGMPMTSSPHASPPEAAGHPELEARLRAKDAEVAKLRAHAMELQDRNSKLEADAEAAASAQQGIADLPCLPSSSAALPGMGSDEAEAHYAKFHELESLVAEQMSVVHQLTEEKKELTVRPLGPSSSKLQQMKTN
jgi:TolA-binding protein